MLTSGEIYENIYPPHVGFNPFLQLLNFLTYVLNQLFGFVTIILHLTGFFKESNKQTSWSAMI